MSEFNFENFKDQLKSSKFSMKSGA